MVSKALVLIAFWKLALAVNITVSSEGGNATSPHQYGFLHEDINNSGDGGLYAELIRNRAFQSVPEVPASLESWSPINGAKLSLKNLTLPLSSVMPTSLNVGPGVQQGLVGFQNDGFWGMDVKKQKYAGSFWVKGDYDGNFKASLQSKITGEVFGGTIVKSKSSNAKWVEHKFELIPKTNAPNSNNTFAVTFDPKGVRGGSLDFNLISLFPPTYKNRQNGMRKDLAQVIKDSHPTLFRLPGGNMLEGRSNTSWWDWKKTLGPLKDRPIFYSPWGYLQTNGLGLMEYLNFAEDMDLEIVVAVFGGLALNGDITPPEKLQPFIDDALDQIEFISGPVTSKWGAVRSKLGHPKPFKLEYVEVGNEDWLAGSRLGWESYKAYRFPRFLKAINAKYPHINVISSGAVHDGYDIPSPGWGDYHIYATPDILVDQFDLFDHVTTKHIIGEMATVHPNGGTGWAGPQVQYPWWIGAVAEGVSLIAYERNSKSVISALYAPIMRSLDRWQWSITMIQYAADPAMTTKSVSWYVWELFGRHLITRTLPSTSDFNPLYYVAGKNEDTGSFIFKGAVYNSTAGADVPVSISFPGIIQGAVAELTVLSGPENPYGFNDPFTGVNVVKTTQEKIIAGQDGVFEFDLPDLSVAVLKTRPTKLAKRALIRRKNKK